MKRYLKINGWWIPLEDMTNEEHWSPTARAIAYVLFVIGVGVTFYMLLHFGGN